MNETERLYQRMRGGRWGLSGYPQQERRDTPWALIRFFITLLMLSLLGFADVLIIIFAGRVIVPFIIGLSVFMCATGLALIYGIVLYRIYKERKEEAS